MSKLHTYTLEEIWLALNEWRWPWCKDAVTTEADREAIRRAWRSLPRMAAPRHLR